MSQISLPQKYWNMFFEFKIAEYYYQFYSIRADRQRMVVSGLATVGSASFILAWYQTGKYSALWSLLILLAQILTALQPQLPFEKRLTAACYIYSDLSHLNLEVEKTWSEFTEESSDKEFEEKIFSFQEEYQRIEERFANPNTFPANKRIHTKAQANAKIFFRRFK